MLSKGYYTIYKLLGVKNHLLTLLFKVNLYLFIEIYVEMNMTWADGSNDISHLYVGPL